MATPTALASLLISLLSYLSLPRSAQSFTVGGSMQSHHSQRRMTGTDGDVNGATGSTEKQKELIIENISPKKKKIDLMWCSSDNCKDVVRERVVGDHNQIILNGPATGQVAYYWNEEANTATGKKVPTETSSVLLLIKPGDEELLKTAAGAVKQWTKKDRIRVLLVEGVAAKLKHYYGVDDDLIELFELPEDPNKSIRPARYNDWYDEEITYENQVIPDLICTLGGDGLLMYASSVFQGAVPPIISIAGGSLGFLTPFSRDEMADAVRLSLGIVKTDENGQKIRPDESPEVFPPNMSSYPYEPIVKAPHVPGDTPKMAFGLGDAICLSIRMRLDCRIVNPEGVVKARYNVLNEVVVDRGSSSYLAALECFCDDVHLTTVQADGIIFATPTGSTAYSMAAGGSVVHPAVPCMLVTPICPHVLSFRAMTFPDHVVLRCYVPDDARTHASVSFDGKHRRELPRGYSVWIKMSPYPVPTLNRRDHSSDWLEALKRSFNFNTRPRQRPM